MHPVSRTPQHFWQHQVTQQELDGRISKRSSALKRITKLFPKAEGEVKHEDRTGRKRYLALLDLAARTRTKELSEESDLERNAAEINWVAQTRFPELGYLYESVTQPHHREVPYRSYLQVKRALIDELRLSDSLALTEDEVKDELHRLRHELPEVLRACEEGCYQPREGPPFYFDFKQVRDLHILHLEQSLWQLELEALLPEADSQALAVQRKQLREALKHWQAYEVDADPEQRARQDRRDIADLKGKIAQLETRIKELKEQPTDQPSADPLNSLPLSSSDDEGGAQGLGRGVQTLLDDSSPFCDSEQEAALAEIKNHIDACEARKVVYINRLTLKLQQQASASPENPTRGRLALFMDGVRKLVEPIVKNEPQIASLDSSKYAWRGVAWAQALVNDSEAVHKERGALAEVADLFRTGFVDAVDRLEDIRHELEQQLKIVDVHIAFLEGRSASPQKARTLNDLAVLKDENELQTLHVVRRGLDNQIRSAKRQRQLLFVNGLTDAVGERQAKIRSQQKQLRKLKTVLQVQAEGLGEQQQGADPNICSVRDAITGLRECCAQLEAEAATLSAACREQIKVLSSIEAPKQGLLEGFSEELRSKVLQYLSLGYANQQIPPLDALDLRLQFAELGYTFEEGIKQFGDLGDHSLPTFLKEQVEDFFRFADAHPSAAVQLLSDLALTCAQLGGEDIRQHLLRGIRTRLYTRAALGKLGRAEAPRADLTEQDFKWRALADAMRWAPKVAALPGVAMAAGQGLSSGGILGMFLGAAKQFVQSEVSVQVAQDVLDNVQDEFLPLLQAALQASRGDDFVEIQREMAQLAVVELAGNARRAWSDPSGAMEALRTAVHRQWKCYRAAKTTEKVCRVAAQVVLPGGMLALAGAAAVTAGAVGAVVGITSVALLMTQILPAVAVALNSLPGFKATAERVLRAEVEALVDEHYEEQIRSKVEALQADPNCSEVDADALAQQLREDVVKQVMAWQSPQAFKDFEARRRQQEEAVRVARERLNEQVLSDVPVSEREAVRGEMLARVM